MNIPVQTDLDTLAPLLDRLEARANDTLRSAQYADHMQRWELDACARATQILAACKAMREAVK